MGVTCDDDIGIAPVVQGWAMLGNLPGDPHRCIIKQVQAAAWPSVWS
jgi:hypothetical protein